MYWVGNLTRPCGILVVLLFNFAQFPVCFPGDKPQPFYHNMFTNVNKCLPAVLLRKLNRIAKIVKTIVHFKSFISIFLKQDAKKIRNFESELFLLYN